MELVICKYNIDYFIQNSYVCKKKKEIGITDPV